MPAKPVAELSSTGRRVFRCKATDCSFEARKLRHLESHIKGSHEYCWKCYIFFDEWQDMVDHKFQDPKHVNDPDELPICQYCGIEFQYQVQREEHFIKFHPVVHSLECIGCKKSFDGPSSYIDHIERRYCRKITPDNFYGRVQHKLVLRDILSIPENVQRLLRKDFTGAADDSDTSINGVTVDPTPANDSSPRKKEKFDGDGVLLTDQDDIGRSQQSKCASYPNSTTSEMDGASVTSQEAASYQQQGVSPELLSKFMALDASTPTTLNKAGFLANDRGDHQDEVRTEFPTNPFRQTHAWENEQNPGDNSGSGCIFGPGGDHLFGLATWDPNHPDFNCEPFYNPVQECYACPYPRCRIQLPTRMSVQEHFASDHAIREAKCPSCAKSFKKFSALIAHATSQINRRCKVFEVDDFAHFIDFITGGLVAVEETKGKREEGMEAKWVKRYHAVIPVEWNVGDKKKKVVVGRTDVATK